LVAGVIFFIVRAFFALIPGLADRAPIKKWAAFAALLVTGFYLILSGNQVATQRSFIMIGAVLLGVLFDRPALTMRTLSIGFGRAGVRPGVDRASELPNVIRRDAGADRRL
jgi:competence protein ComEC